MIKLTKKSHQTIKTEGETRYDEKRFTLELDFNKDCQLIEFIGYILSIYEFLQSILNLVFG